MSNEEVKLAFKDSFFLNDFIADDILMDGFLEVINHERTRFN